MKNILKALSICILSLALVSPALAKSVLKENKFDKIIKSNEINKTATIAVSIREAKSGKVIYENEQDKLLNPASTLKLISSVAAIDTLGKDYCFKTQLLIDKDSNVYIKLGADPLLTSNDLKVLIKSLRNKQYKSVNNVYIDDSIFDNVDWGTGWMWDDNTNPYMTKFSAYNLDNNVLKINVTKNTQGEGTNVQPLNLYPMAIINKVVHGSSSNISVNRYDWQSPDIIELTGTVNSPIIASVPINNMRRYFSYQIEDFLNRNNIKYNNQNFTSKITPANALLIGETTHEITAALPLILKQSDNRTAETIAKLAAAKANNSTATNELTKKLLVDFYTKKQVPTDKIVFADASGVSRNNLISTDWISFALHKLYCANYFDALQDYMAQPGEGTLNNRLLDQRGNVWLKTGSISNASGISGFVKSQSGNFYTISILVQNFIQPQSEAKKLEDEIIKAVYDL